MLLTFTYTSYAKVMTNNSMLEITESEYLIKLNRSNFNLSFIRSLLKIVEVANPREDNFSTPDRNITYNQNHQSEPDYFSSLEEK
ncbi:hypothetical protein GCM10022392_03400 [Mucilaginibacter panaciglaebae]|uniref:Uncharacterized protein n=2 Tax=Mucilaginibacter panaciglaebae TaxID=502331 RepID=A0ABP7WC68_9SPHI